MTGRTSAGLATAVAIISGSDCPATTVTSSGYSCGISAAWEREKDPRFCDESGRHRPNGIYRQDSWEVVGLRTGSASGSGSASASASASPSAGGWISAAGFGVVKS